MDVYSVVGLGIFLATMLVAIGATFITLRESKKARRHIEEARRIRRAVEERELREKRWGKDATE